VGAEPRPPRCGNREFDAARREGSEEGSDEAPKFKHELTSRSTLATFARCPLVVRSNRR